MPSEFFIAAYGGNSWGDWDQAFVVVNDLDGQPETLAKIEQILEIGKTVSYCQEKFNQFIDFKLFEGYERLLQRLEDEETLVFGIEYTPL